jgi:hypothetical protein
VQNFYDYGSSNVRGSCQGPSSAQLEDVTSTVFSTFPSAPIVLPYSHVLKSVGGNSMSKGEQ